MWAGRSLRARPRRAAAPLGCEVCRTASNRVHPSPARRGGEPRELEGRVCTWSGSRTVANVTWSSKRPGAHRALQLLTSRGTDILCQRCQWAPRQAGVSAGRREPGQKQEAESRENQGGINSQQRAKRKNKTNNTTGGERRDCFAGERQRGPIGVSSLMC